ncbi:zinc ribbon domain-containing protein [Exiguobacterium sp. s26]|uniref:zinc ribbon domain-containing protein n=1 Tax=Exiguobacterium sp. s26 TaxID=2751231 RepID=UPI001BEB9E38|nr:zinc ribbon domain-containing protein [Exiguobacterium sp. s26]
MLQTNCTKCDLMLEEGFNFCPKCGQKIFSEDEIPGDILTHKSVIQKTRYVMWALFVILSLWIWGHATFLLESYDRGILGYESEGVRQFLPFYIMFALMLTFAIAVVITKSRLWAIPVLLSFICFVKFGYGLDSYYYEQAALDHYQGIAAAYFMLTAIGLFAPMRMAYNRSQAAKSS